MGRAATAQWTTFLPFYPLPSDHLSCLAPPPPQFFLISGQVAREFLKVISAISS